MATHSSLLAWKIQWTERSLVGCCPWGHKESDMIEQLITLSLHYVELHIECALLCFVHMFSFNPHSDLIALL